MISLRHNSHASKLVWDCVANQLLAVLLLQALCASVLPTKFREEPMKDPVLGRWVRSTAIGGMAGAEDMHLELRGESASPCKSLTGLASGVWVRIGAANNERGFFQW